MSAADPTIAERSKRHRAKQLSLRTAQAKRVEELEAALRAIVAVNQTKTWTATEANPETHWETSDGPYATVARQALEGGAKA